MEFSSVIQHCQLIDWKAHLVCKKTCFS